MDKPIDFAGLEPADVLDLGILAEEEARQRYREFSEMMEEEHGNPVAAEFFAFMEQNEIRHREALESQRHGTYPDAPTRVDASMLFDVEAPEYGVQGDALDLESCLRIALESEKKAERFYRDALSVAANPEVHDLLVQLADQEVRHQKLLRDRLASLPDIAGAE